ncbi:MAG: DUF5040 domain-containing protein [Muribaculaceae bacterium]|nr:DUF5040 domain-containing protein [Muribaculaceae bacterium]
MKKIAILFAAAALAVPASHAVDGDGRPVVLLTGASFAVPNNGWFEIGCNDLDAVAVNKAVSGEAIYHTARAMNAGTLYTTALLDEIDVFVIDHVHNQNVANEEWIKDSWEDYTNIASTTDYSVAYDYVIKRYIADCKALKDNPDSKFYGTAEGKPAKIILCTHWHDSRTTYNPAIRKLAERWGFPLVEFDKNIGFSKDDVAAGEPQPSLAQAHDTETIGGVKYGWHPLRGDKSYIQRRMAQIFVSVAAPVLGVEVPFEASLSPLSPIVAKGEQAAAALVFRGGQYPFALSYDAGETNASFDAFAEMPHIIETPAESAVKFSLSSATDADGAESPQAYATVYVAHKSIAPSFDGYIHEAFKEQNYTTNETLQLKNGDNWSRRIYITFPTEEIDVDADHIAVRIYFDSYTLGTLNNEKRPQDGVETLEIGGNTAVYGATLKWSTSSSHVFEPITSTILATNMQNKWIGFDVTDWAKAKVAGGAKHLTFRITTPYRWGSLTNFVATENKAHPELAPQMLMAMNPVEDGVATVGAASALGFDGSTLTNATGAPATVVALDGTVRYAGADTAVDLSFLPAGLYVASAGGNVLKVVVK